MTTFKIMLELAVDERWLKRFAPNEEIAVGNTVLELLETPDFVPDSHIEVRQID